jgi:carbonic anhydrase
MEPYSGNNYQEEKIVKIKLLSIVFVGLSMSSALSASEAAHWGYTGHSGPAHWGDLSPEFAVCSSGKNQSPIDLTGMVEGELPELVLDYGTGGHQIVNNGHTVKINYTPGSKLTAAGQSYELKQVHFHAPSENTIEGRSYPMEGHFVHADSGGNLAVVSVLYDYGEANAQLQKAWLGIPQQVGKVYPLYDHVDANGLLPDNRDYYRFNGSLTTPPCSEGVKWFVIKQIDTVSKEQAEMFSKIMGVANNRPVQPVNARIVIQ